MTTPISFSNLQTQIANALPLTGGILSGPLTVLGDIVGNIDASSLKTGVIGIDRLPANISASILGDVQSDLIPTTSNARDLGSQSKRWRNLYLGGNALSFGDGVTFGSYDWSYLQNYIVPPAQLVNPSARQLFSGASSGHSGFVSGGQLYMMGANASGQLGLGDTTKRTVPTIVPGLSGVTVAAVACGGEFTCVITSTGTAYAFGRNFNGQLGDASTTNRSSPVLVNGISTAIAVAAGQNHVLYLLSNGTVVGYGSSLLGQLGNGGSNNVNTTLVLVTMPSPTDATFRARFVACGSYHSTMLLENGSCYTWGDNTHKQLGYGVVTSSSLPVVVPDVSNVVSAACGEYHTILVRYGGDVLTFGRNNFGQLGVGSTNVVTTPTTIITGSGGESGLSISVGAGASHSIVALADGSIRVFGSNASGQLGVGPSVTQYTLPTNLPGFNAFSVTCGRDWTLMLLNNSALYTNAIVAMGGNIEGQLGDDQPNTNIRWIPNRIYESAGRRLLMHSSSTSGSSMFADTDGVAYGFGLGTSGQLGDGYTTNANIAKPLSVVLPRITSISGGLGHIAVVASGVAYSCGLNTYGVHGNGLTTSLSRPVAVASGSILNKTITSVACGEYHTLFIDSTANVHSIGYNASGQLGDNTIVNKTAPIAVTGGSLSGKSVVSIGAGTAFSAALDSTGQASVWGQGTSGQIGDGGAVQRNVPTAVVGGSLTGKVVISIACGSGHVIAIDSSLAAHGWGLNTSSQLGDNSAISKNSPVALLSGSISGKKIVAVSAGGSHTLFLDSTGAVHACGANTNGRLGDGTSTSRTTPVLISGGSLNGLTVVAIFAGSAHSMALASNNTLHSWGEAANGKLGDGIVTDRLVPGLVSQLNRDSYVRMGSEGSLGTHKLLMNRNILDDRKIVDVVGSNTYYQLGDGTNVDKGYSQALTFSADVVQASASNDHSAVVLSNGQVYLFGRNDQGQCGSSVITSSVSTPRLLAGVTNATDAQCGDQFTLVLLADRSVVALGSNNSSRMGIADTIIALTGNTSSITQVTGLTDIVRISAGPSFALACDTLGRLWTWGSNASGATGQGTAVGTTAVPTRVSASAVNASGDTVVDVVAGETHAAIVVQDVYGNRKVYTAGTNLYGQLGRSTNAQTSTPVTTFAPVDLGTSANPIRIACGRHHTVVQTSNHRIYTFGRNSATQLGVSGADRTTPYLMSDPDVLSVTCGSANTYIELAYKVIRPYGTYYATISGYALPIGVSALAVGSKGCGGGVGSHAGIVSRTGQLGMWGLNSSSQLGDGGTTNRSTPVWITGGSLDPSLGKRVVGVSCGASHTLVIASDGSLHGFGLGTTGQLGSVGSKTVPALSTNGTLSGKIITAVACGSNHSMALDNTGGVHSFGTITLSTAITHTTPILLTGSLVGRTAVAISAGYVHNLILDSTGAIHAFGERLYGRLGDGYSGGVTSATQQLPILISGGSVSGRTITAIAAGGQHSLFLDSTKRVHTCGFNSSGQCGDGTVVEKVTPIEVTGGSLGGKNIIAIAAGSTHTVALDDTYQIHAWGSGSSGQLGDNTATQQNLPVAVTLNIGPAVSISCGASTTYALDSSSNVWVWGTNTSGQLGDSSTTQRNAPVMLSSATAFAAFNVGSGTTPLFINFTGQHRCYLAGTTRDSTPHLEGLVVVSDTNQYMNTQRKGASAITINESLPLVSIAHTANDKRAFGVISLSYNEAPLTVDATLELQHRGDVRVHVNSVGEGGIWVCDANGALEAGDYVTTSDVPGYGQRQADDVMRNSTVAKVTMACDFTAPLVAVEEIRRDAYNQIVLDAATGAPVWDIVLENGEPKMEPAYALRFLDGDGTLLDETEYASRIALGLPAYKAAFCGCTYHCG